MRDYLANNAENVGGVRRDASKNRRVIIQVARRLFEVNGISVTLSDIAKESGVSRATIYRNFTDMQSVALAVSHYNLDGLERYSRKLAKRDDGGFFTLLQIISEQQAKYHAIVQLLPPIGKDITDRVVSIFKKPIEKAKQSKLLRLDFDNEEDLLLVVSMISGANAFSRSSGTTFSVQRLMLFLSEGIE